MSSSDSKSGGMGMCSTLFVVFLILKLTGVITWSWFWIFFPLIFGTILVVFAVAIALLIIKGQEGGGDIGAVSFIKTRYASISKKVKDKRVARKSEKDLQWAKDLAQKREESAQDIEHRFEIMDVKDGGFKAKGVAPISYRKVASKPKKPRFSLKTWWTEGNRKAAEKKVAKKLVKKQKKT